MTDIPTLTLATLSAAHRAARATDHAVTLHVAGTPVFVIVAPNGDLTVKENHQ